MRLDAGPYILEQTAAGWIASLRAAPAWSGSGGSPQAALDDLQRRVAKGMEEGAARKLIVAALLAVPPELAALSRQADSARTVAAPTGRALQIKVTLRHVRPPIWRRIVLSDTMTLDTVHRVVQAAMGWTDTHLHGFRKGNQTYALPSRPEFDFGMPSVDERSVAIGALLGRPKDGLVYDYDFGDGWEHDIVLEKVLPPEDAPSPLPRVVAGKRACPPEDCGGPPGYEGYLAAIANPKDPAHADLLAWRGAGFDPEEFDLEAANTALSPRRPRARPRSRTPRR